MPVRRFARPHAEGIQSVDLRQPWLSTAKTALDRDGAVVLTGTGLADAAAVTGEQMLVESELLLPYLEELTVYAAGHLRQYPPTGSDSRVLDVLRNPALHEIARAVLGPECYLANYMGHTVLPGSHTQPVHADWGPLWADYPDYHPPFLLAYNLALVPTDESNGSVEVWPGTHRRCGAFNAGALTVREAELTRQARSRPPEQVVMAAGDLLIRDVRTWHRGTHNPSATARPMIFGLLAAEWYRYQSSRPLVLSEALADQVPEVGIAVACEFTAAEFDPVRWSIDSGTELAADGGSSGSTSGRRTR